MLAKWWKRIALLICIVAILFNITYKLVHRTNIKEQLTTVIGSEAIKFSEDKKEENADTTEENNK